MNGEHVNEIETYANDDEAQLIVVEPVDPPACHGHDD